MSWHIVVSDDTGDYYVIPLDKQEEWDQYLEDIWSENPPQPKEWAHYVGGFPQEVKFKEWEKRS